MIVSTAVLCLAVNIYHEARSETIPGQYAVALVTMNRAGHDHTKVCHEIFKPQQFSWTGGVTRISSGWSIPKSMTPTGDAWDRAVRISAWTLAGNMPDFTRGSTHYHTKAVRPVWAAKLHKTKEIGFHKFYVDSRKSVLTASL